MKATYFKNYLKVSQDHIQVKKKSILNHSDNAAPFSLASIYYMPIWHMLQQIQNDDKGPRLQGPAGWSDRIMMEMDHDKQERTP